MTKPKQYLGDSVYAEIDSCDYLILTTENGTPFSPTNNKIYLKPEVLQALIQYIEAEVAP
jgi:hypothetical protein